TLAYYRKALKADDFNYSKVKEPGRLSKKKVNVVNCWDEMVDISVGTVTKEAGTASFKALVKVVDDMKAGLVDAVVTAPINKHNIQSEQFHFPGHTEFFTTKFDSKESLMFLVSENLRVGVVTGHIPLKEVSNAIGKNKIETKINIMEKSLQNDFGIKKPKIAVLGLNPHAGEDGLLGNEDQDIIKPVINKFRDVGKLIHGPFPADGFFGKGDYKKFDGILAMYHDQGLIPFKTIAFQTGVNYTAGLPIIRTSPDHGTAYSIAGKDEASEASMRRAIYLATDIFRNRQMNNAL
ncbi:MAG: 4-hydroxythreonine-4-phosphate dehydrogenase PdxA, partial [Fulvivirga sp.]|nr:4-hydroxythreonine-4-phosphate dehydrogenase PdxA [Fulvivirga sp.]